MAKTLTIVDFSADESISEWRVVDDVVMGGRSDGNIALNSAGNAVFSGEVSLENNGGFSSVRRGFEPLDVSNYSKFILRLKGDGKRYQFRVKSSEDEYYSYIGYIQTTDEWAEYEIEFNEMYPAFRGRKLDQPNYPGDSITEIAFLIGNKKAQHFELEIDKVELQ